MSKSTNIAELSRRYKRFRKWYLSMSEEEQNASLGQMVFSYIQHLDSQLKTFERAIATYSRPSGNYQGPDLNITGFQ